MFINPSECRIICGFIITGVGIALLTDATFQTSWRTVSQFSLLRAGLSPMNTSFIPDYVNETIPFWYYYSAALTDSTYVTPISPLSCSGDDCSSYFYPGGITRVFPSPPTITGYNDANRFVVYDTPGYQVDFYSPTSTVVWSASDCKAYGVQSPTDLASALGICLKQVGNDLVADKCCILDFTDSRDQHLSASSQLAC